MERDENQNVEYKESWHDKYLEWIWGYANAKGGTFYIGIEDKPKREDSISECDRSGDARMFVEFMLKALRDALVEVKRGVGKGVVKSVVKILDLLKQYRTLGERGGALGQRGGEESGAIEVRWQGEGVRFLEKSQHPLAFGRRVC